MDCKQARSLLSAYVDGELDARSSLEVEEHFVGCGQCERDLEAMRQTKTLVAQVASYYRAPADLRRVVQASILAPKISQGPRVARVLAFAASIVLALGLGWMVGRNGLSPEVNSQLVASHVRALMSDHVADVISTDKHTVKPWFNGKIDFSPSVTDFASQGFPMIGGRLEYLDGKRVAVLVYKRQKHVIDLYVAAGSSSSAESGQSSKGFNVVHWRQGDFEYWAVSDLNAPELRQFADLVQKSS